MFDQEKTGKFIAENRRQKELTQKDLAEKLGISDKTVSKWETGHGMPDVSVIPELCEILSVNSNELLAGEKLESAESFSQKAEENVMDLMKTIYYVNIAFFDIEDHIDSYSDNFILYM